jgi:hypothetical protein
MNIKKIAAVTVITLSFITSAQAAKLIAVDKNITTNLCMTAAAGNRAAMHIAIKSSGYSSKFVANKVQCNSENLLSFIEHNGKNSSSMLKMLDRRQTSVSITDLANNTLEEK